MRGLLAFALIPSLYRRFIMTFSAKFISFFLSIASFFLTLFGLPGYATGDKVDMDKFTLTWADEFDGSSVDSAKWIGGWWDGKQSHIRRGGYWNTKLATVEDGNLHIATKYYKNGLDDGGAGWYTTQLTTQGKFEQTYGYYEVRCILPSGAGIWSAFWMMCKGVGAVDGSGRDGTEIDIYESAYFTDKNSDTVSSALHYDGYAEAHKSKTVHRTHVYGSDPYTEFNTYGLEWNKDEYIFYVNGIEAGRSSFGGVSQVPEYLLLSVEIGGDDAVPADSWCGKSIENNTSAPTDFIVDYVRVYQYK